jgi:predicted dehydrogenase
MTRASTPSPLLRLGFLGTGWIGRQRMHALLGSGVAEVAAVADPSAENREAALSLAPAAAAVADLDQLLSHDLDGVVIATPSALHAENCIEVLERGLPVFCQKPLARNLPETEAVLAAAMAADRLLGVDLSYRGTAAVAALAEALETGVVADLHAVDLTFHNAYGPDKAWFTQRELSGGGCLIDLGTHLIDLALWLTGARGATVEAVTLRRAGQPVRADGEEVEDFVWAQLRTDTDVVLRIACSWFLPAGRDCVIEASFLGTQEALAFFNVDGSFYDFMAERRSGTERTVLSAPPDEWGGRMLRRWAERVTAGAGADPAEAAGLRATAGVIDAIYAAGGQN